MIPKTSVGLPIIANASSDRFRPKNTLLARAWQRIARTTKEQVNDRVAQNDIPLQHVTVTDGRHADLDDSGDPRKPVCVENDYCE